MMLNHHEMMVNLPFDFAQGTCADKHSERSRRVRSSRDCLRMQCQIMLLNL